MEVAIKGMGALPSPVDVRNYVAACAVNAEEFPNAFELEMPDVKDQGRVGSCVAHALATVVEYFDKKQGDNVGRMSTGYIYGNRSNGYTGRGRHVSVAIRDLCKYGVCAYDAFPENVEVPEAIELVEKRLYNLFPDAYFNRISTYYETRDAASIKAALLTESPVVISMEWFDDIDVDENGMIHTNCVPSGSYHAIVIYGWNEDGWLIQNSWGTDWGVCGRAILPYGVPRREAWGFTDTYSENLRKQKEHELSAKANELSEELLREQIAYENLLESYQKSTLTVTKLTEEMEFVESELRIAETHNKALAEEQADLEEEIKRLRHELQEQMHTTGQSIEALQEIIALKQSELVLVEEERAEMATIIRKLRNEIAGLTDAQIDAEALKDAHAAKTEELELAREELAKAKSAIGNANAALNEMKADMDNANAEIFALIAELEGVRAERAELEKQLIEVKKPYSSAIGKIIAKILNWLMNTFGGDDGTDT